MICQLAIDFNLLTGRSFFSLLLSVSLLFCEVLPENKTKHEKTKSQIVSNWHCDRDIFCDMGNLQGYGEGNEPCLEA